MPSTPSRLGLGDDGLEVLLVGQVGLAEGDLDPELLEGGHGRVAGALAPVRVELEDRDLLEAEVAT
jgi:hypothetical protein